jgi:ABC-type Fe3+/spermidine/putrescine transport system ATPase subunit
MAAAEKTDGAGITASGVAKAFGASAVLHGIDLTVRPGEFVCLLGPSGCGKTTLLRCIAGLERPDAGCIATGERTVVDVARGLFVPPERRRLGMVFQHYALWPHMTVRQNIAYPLRKQGVPRAARADLIRQVSTLVGLPDLLDRHPSQLSGGQQQRVALARALVYEPPILLLDEPLSNLDAAPRGQLRRELRRLHERLGTTTVLLTHDQEEAAALADTIAVMYQGRIVQAGSASTLLERPRTRFVAEFVGFDTFVSGRIAGHRGERTLVTLAAGASFEVLAAGAPAAGAEVVIAARSDSLRLCRAGADNGGAALRGAVHCVARVGRATEFEIMADGQLIVVRETGADQGSGLLPGGEVEIDFLHGRAALVAKDGD